MGGLHVFSLPVLKTGLLEIMGRRDRSLQVWAVTAGKLVCVTTESTKGKNFETFLKCRCTNYSCQERQWHFVIKSYVYFPLLNTHTLVFPEREACNAIQWTVCRWIKYMYQWNKTCRFGGFLPPTFALGSELPNDDTGGLCKDLKLRRISLKSQMERDTNENTSAQAWKTKT